MTDDIVTRLRGKYAGQLLICTEAADEIERLRAEVLRLDFQSKFWQSEFVSCWRDLKGDRQ